VINYTLLGSASGFSLATSFSAYSATELTRFFAVSAIIVTVLAFVGRSVSLIRNSRLKPKSTLQTAIGVKHPRIVQKSQGFTGGSFNTKEFFHGKTMNLLRSIKWFFLISVFVLPPLLLFAGIASGSTALLVLAFVVQYLGLVAERWYFFAQANHPQNLYYQAIA